MKNPLEKFTVPRKESVPPDVTEATTRKRVEKLRDVSITLREDDDVFPVNREALAHKFGQCKNASKLTNRFWRENENKSRMPSNH